MFKFIIYYKDGNKIEIQSDDNSNLKEVTDIFDKIIKSNKIFKLTIGNNVLILKATDILGIHIIDLKSSEIKENDKTNKVQNKEKIEVNENSTYTSDEDEYFEKLSSIEDFNFDDIMVDNDENFDDVAIIPSVFGTTPSLDRDDWESVNLISGDEDPVIHLESSNETKKNEPVTKINKKLENKIEAPDKEVSIDINIPKELDPNIADNSLETDDGLNDLDYYDDNKKKTVPKFKKNNSRKKAVK
jgi:hypothetical protein